MTEAESSGHARGTFSHHLIPPPFDCSLQIPLLSPSFPVYFCTCPFPLLSAYYVRFDIVACPSPSPPAFPASRPSPSITQKEEGRFTRKKPGE